MSEIIVVVVAFVAAFLMAFKPEMFVIHPEHRTPKFVRSIKYIGISVCIVLSAMFIANYIL